MDSQFIATWTYNLLYPPWIHPTHKVREPVHNRTHVPCPPPPVGAHSPPAVATPLLRTDKPWTDVVKDATTTTAPTPDRSFESNNLFSHLHSDDDVSSNNSSRISRDLLTPGTDDNIPQPGDEIEGVPHVAKVTDNVVGSLLDDTGTASAPRAPTAPPALSFSELFAIAYANTTSIANLTNTVQDNNFQLQTSLTTLTGNINNMQTSLTTLTSNVNNMSSSIASLTTALTDAKDTAERAFHQATAATITLTSQGVRLDDLTDTVSTLRDDICPLRNQVDPSPDLHALIHTVLGPLETSLTTKVIDTVNLATATAEKTIRTSFDQTATDLSNRVTVSLEEFEKQINALHGSTYGHLKKTTLPEFSRCLDALEAHTSPYNAPDYQQTRPLWRRTRRDCRQQFSRSGERQYL